MKRTSLEIASADEAAKDVEAAVRALEAGRYLQAAICLNVALANVLVTLREQLKRKHTED